MEPNTTVQMIQLPQLALAFVPVLIVIAVFYVWKVESWTSVYAFIRMSVQLLLVGYILTYLFEVEYPLVIVGVLILMMLVSSWIALRPLKSKLWRLYLRMLFAISASGTAVLFVVSEGILTVDPWFLPRYLVPLAGLVYANSMNTVSLAAERFEAVFEDGADYYESRRTALTAALIPMINTLLAVGLVALPGLMSGQVLSGVPPLVAVRYQIVIMCMIFAAGAGAALIYLYLLKPKN